MATENLTCLLDSFCRDRPKGRRDKNKNVTHTGPRCPFAPHPAFIPRTSWSKRVQIVWSQWLFQPWPQLWISLSWLIGPYVQSEPCAAIWKGLSPQVEQGAGFVSFRNGFSPATISSWIKQTVILCNELTDQESLTLHQVKAHDVRVFATSKAFQSVSLEQTFSACHWKSHSG